MHRHIGIRGKEYIHPKIGGVGNADRIWASTPQNPASEEGVLGL